ncbi:MAG: DUF4465 domain-containing protein [Oscillospiraceae bacterium]|nr:DUF4465 domain-containing protein [Oscillospiraceae bacterium]
MKKRLLSLLLVVLIVLGMLPASALAADGDIITGAYLDTGGTQPATVIKSTDTLSVYDYMVSGNIQLPVYDIAVPEGTETVYVAHSGSLSGNGDYFSASGSADYSTYFTPVTTSPYIGVSVSSLIDTGKYLALYNSSWSYATAVRFVTAEPELSYEIRTLTFEDADYKGDINFAGKQDWSSLIDSSQYGGEMLYPDGSGTTDVSKAYTWYDKGNTELTHTLPYSFNNYCYWSGGHAVSNYNSGDVETYGNYSYQLTVFKKGTTDVATTSGGYNGSNNFAVHFGYKDDSGYTDGQVLPSISFADGVARVIDHMYVNNTCYALNCFVNGNDLTSSISESDWVKVVATGYDASGGTKTAEIYLCNGPDNIVMDWTKWDLSVLGAVTKVEFNVLGTSDNGYGFSQPGYFAYDNVAVRFEKEAPVAVTGVTLDKAEADVEVGSTVTLTATVSPENATDKTMNWSSSDETVATVADGVVTAVARGEATITVQAGEFTATCVVTVSNAVDATGVTLDKTELSMARWTTETLTATVSPEDANEKTVTWSSSDEKVASVADGVITANGEGTATITVTTTDGSFTAVCAVTVTDAEKPETDDDGYYIIDSAADLMWFAKHVNSAAVTNTDNAKMTCDIDLSTVVGSGLGNWVPIGDADVGASYGGIFDGGSFTITNMYYKSGTDKYAGLFGHTKGATVKNLTIANATFERSKSYAGAFIGYAENTTVENCHNNLYLKGTGSGNSYYAGIIGYAVDCTVRNSSNVGCGHDDCELAGSATICPQPGKIQGGSNCGGIIGYAEGTTVIENCFNSGYVYGYGGGYTGGIVGQASGSIAIKNCYNTGRMSTYASYAHVYIGGIAGQIAEGSTAEVTNCYNTGLLYTASTVTDSYKHLASIVALNNGTLTAENCYYLDTQAADENATAKTAAEMSGLADTLGAAYIASCGTPVLTWQTAAEHTGTEDRVCDTCGASTNQKPVLKEGVSSTKEAVTSIGYAFNVTELQYNEIFEDPDGDELNYASYWYERSTDGGVTWSEKANFPPSDFGFTTIQFTETEAGTYMYRFYAWDGYEYSDDTYTITLTVSNEVPLNFTFYVGRDNNYNSSSNPNYPIIKLYKTAGVDGNSNDYVGWFEKDGAVVYVYNPAMYTIEGNETDGYTADGYTLHDYEPIQFTNSLFGAEPAEGETVTESGTVVSNYNMFYASIPQGHYSYRAYGYNTTTATYNIYLGGQQLILPTEVNVDGGAGGGTSIYLRLLSVYTNSKKTDGTYFTEDEYDIEIMMPKMECKVQHGYTYISGNYTYYPFMIYSAGNAALFNIVANPSIDGYIFNQTINNTQTAGYTAMKKSIAIKAAVKLTVTVPENADFGLYYQWNNFNTDEVDSDGMTVNSDGTKTITYTISSSNSNYTWRLTDPNGKYVTRAGWLKSQTADSEMTLIFDKTDEKSHDFSGLGTTVAQRDEADLQIFVDDSGFMSTTETYRVRAYRMWQLINSDTANIMIEPDFNVQVLSGNAGDVKQVDGNNGEGNWIDVTPTTTDIIAVSYDALDVDTSNNKTHGGFFPATNPERTGVFVMTNETAGTADAHIEYNRNVTATSRSEEWDYNYDTWFYMDTDTAPTLDFTVSATDYVSVSYATVITDSSLKSTLSDWTAVSADESGNYSIDLLGFRKAGALGGTVIIKMTDSTGISYRLVRVAQMSVNIENASNPGEPIMPGDDVTITFDGLYRSVNKIAGIFNPTTYYLRYTSGETEINGKLGQYQKMDNASITLTIPEDMEIGEDGKAQYTFTNGYVFGSMYAAADPFSMMYAITDTGVGTNFNAVTVNFCIHNMADITVDVVEKVVYDVKINVTDGENAVSGAVVTVTDSDGNAVAADESGIYQDLSYGEYKYSVMLAGYICNYGSFSLGSANESEVKDGIITKDVVLTKASENAWDGKTITEPKIDENGVYQIGTGAELAWFAALVNGTLDNMESSMTTSAVLTADIDLAGYEWTPIGTASACKLGSFDGQNHKITNLSINYSATDGTAPYKGLFGRIEGEYFTHAVIKNFSIDGAITLTSTASVSTANCAAVICQAKYVTIENVHSNVDITVDRVAGNWARIAGIVAYSTGDSEIINCSNSGDLTGYNYVGGIIAYGGEGNTGVTITGCVNTGDIVGDSGYVAGIAVYNQSTISCCYNTGDITTAGNYAGGIVANANAITVTNCFNTGIITCGAKNYGAIVGSYANATGVSTNNYYLEGTCSAGIGAVKNEETQITTAVSSETMASEQFVATMNTGLDTAAFKEGNGHPVLTWQEVVVEEPETFEVTLPTGEGYTVTGEKTATEGEAYTFTITVADGYRADESFAVKVNGEAVTGKSGSYTVESVSSDLVITVEGIEKIPAVFNVTLPVDDAYTVIGAATITEGEDYTFTVEVSVGYKAGENFGVKVNGEALEANDDGSYTVADVASELGITVEGVEEVKWDPVTVYFSVSHDEKFVAGKESDTVMALQEISVPYFDLSLYGMESFYFASETYGDDGDGEPGSALNAGTAQFAYGKITMLHMFIYATEIYYCGLDPEDAGKGYLYKENLLGSDTLTYTGSVGSIYFAKFWGMDENLNYYLNYEYPLASEGWGSTADQILLEEGDVVTVGHFSDWNFFTDPNSVFNYIKSGDDTVTTTATQGNEITMSVYLAGADESGKYSTAHTAVTSKPDVYYISVDSLESSDVSNWNHIGTADENGDFVVDTASMKPGQYIIAVGGQYGVSDGMTDAICSTPGAIILNVEEIDYYANYPFDSIYADGETMLIDIKEGTADGSNLYAGDIPTYQVIVPEGTQNVQITFPNTESFVIYTGVYEVSTGSTGYGYDSVTVTANDDGTVTVTIPAANYTDTGNGIILENSNYAMTYGFDFVVGTPSVPGDTNKTPVTGVALDKSELSFDLGDEVLTATITATVSPEDATNTRVIWESSDDTIATVSKGTVTAVGVGTATITVTTADGGFTATCSVTVTDVNAPETDENGVYLITTAAQLKWFADKVNSGSADINAKLMNDIDLSTVCGEGVGSWTPIGDYSVNKSYTGDFDGQGYTISNFYMNETLVASDGMTYYRGFFGLVESATIKNLNLTGSITTNGRYIGALAGCVGYYSSGAATVENCHVDVDITFTGGPYTYGFGGIAGQMRNGSTIKDCSYSGTLSGALYCIGGIVGTNFYGNNTVTGCKFNGTINAVGNADSDFNGAGGIVGLNDSDAELTIENCYSIGTITSTGTVAVGGILGADNGTATISNVYSASITEGANVGGILGSDMDTATTSTAANAYYLDTSASADIIGGISKTETELKSSELLTALGAGYKEDTGTINSGYPVLTWEVSEAAYLLGDVNGDGKINAVDAALTYKYVNNKTELTEAQLLAADVNGDGKVTAVDAALIYKYVNNKLDVFPAEQ